MAVRHGESAANAAFAEAARRGEPLAFPRPDSAVPLTDRGRKQAAALGRWLAALPEGRRPQVAWTSTYLRARETLRIVCEQLADPPPVHEDERLIDRVMGELSLLNPEAVAERFPEEARRREEVGWWVYRPPGGESFPDIAARLRSFLADLEREAAGRRVLIVAHDSVVALLRHVLEHDDDTDVRHIAGYGEVRNTAISTWERRDGRLHLVEFNAVPHL